MKRGKEGVKKVKPIDLVKEFESCRLKAYKAVPTEKYYTIGWGHYGSDVLQGMEIDQKQADAILARDLARFERAVVTSVKVDITENMYAALVSFAYNVGIDAFQKSTLLKLLNANDVIGAANQFPAWNKCQGSVIKGLVNRRNKERSIFMSDIGVREYSLKRDGEIKLSENFKVKEFRCKDGSDKIMIDVNFVADFLQKIRKHFGVPVTVNSAYRTPAYNIKVGGAKASYHMKGQAFDIVVKGHTPKEVAQYAEKLGIHGIIQYNSFVHVDNRSGKYWARNDNGKVRVVNSF